MSNRDEDGKLILHPVYSQESGDLHINEGTAVAFADGELSERGAQRVRAHAATCEDCQKLIDESRRVRSTVAELLATINASAERDLESSARLQSRVLKTMEDSPNDAVDIENSSTAFTKRARVNLGRAGVWKNKRAVLVTTGFVVLAASAINGAMIARRSEDTRKRLPRVADSLVPVRSAYTKLPKVTVYGTVISERGVPINNAVIVVMGHNLSQTIRTDLYGKFDFGSLPRTATTIEVRALGYKTQIIPLQYHDANSLQISAKLIQSVVELDPKVVKSVEKRH